MKHFFQFFLLVCLLSTLCTVRAIAETTENTDADSIDILASAEIPEGAISSIIVAEPELNVAVGSTFQIQFEVFPEDAEYTDVMYVFSDSILELTDNGMIYSNAPGDSTVTILQDDRELGSVAVHAEHIPVEKISVTEEAFSVQVGHTQALSFELLPQNATCFGLEVTSGNPKIATVEFDARGLPCAEITGIAPGKTTLTIKASKKVVARKQISVVDILPEEILVTADTADVYIGNKGALSVSFMPEDVTNSKLTWKSSSSKTVKVNKDGTYQALAVGEAAITASHANGVSGTICINVLPILAERVDLSTNWNAEKPFYRNSTMQLRAAVLPDNTTDKSITWSSSDDSVATVSSKGVVKAISAGNAKITVKTANGIAASFPVSVPVSPQKFRLSASINMISNDHVGNNWSSGLEYNSEPIRSGSIISLLPGDSFSVSGWAEDADSRPDYGCYRENLVLTDEMCKNGFTVEGDIDVRENGGRYSGHCAIWHLKMTFTPAN